MRHIVALLSLLLSPALLAAPAHAQLVEVDLLAPGDKLVTRDTDTNLDWLDLENVTQGLSYDAIQGGAGGWLASGWRYATEAEICALFLAHAAVPSCDFDSGFVGTPPAAAQSLMQKLGITGNISGAVLTAFVHGLYDDATPATTVGRARIEVSTPFAFPPTLFRLVTDATVDAVASNAASATVGSFLVRPVPPVIPALPPLGAALLAALLAFGARAGKLRTRGVE